VRDIIESNERWADINTKSDVIQLLKLIQQAIVAKKTKVHPVHQQAIVAKKTTVHLVQALVESEHDFYAFRQNRLSHSEYFDRFKVLVETVLQKGGDMGAYTDAVIDELAKDGLTIASASTAEYEEARTKCHERYLAMCLILKADKWWVGDLMVDLENEYTRNPTNASYPETLTKAYDMIINYRLRMSQAVDSSGETGVTFYTE